MLFECSNLFNVIVEILGLIVFIEVDPKESIDLIVF